MKYRIAIFPGDGVGPELIDEGTKIIQKAAELDKFDIEWVKYPHCAGHYLETKEVLSEKLLKEIKNSCVAIYCGTFDILRHDSETNYKNISQTIRDYFCQYVNLRPIKLLPSVEGPLIGKTHNEIDFVIIRENTEDFYVNASGRAKNGKNKQQLEIAKDSCRLKFGLDIETKSSEIAYQIGVLSKKGCERIIRYAFEYAQRNNKKKITSIDKANVMEIYNFWRENIEKISKEYPNINCDYALIDSAVINFILQPEKFEIIIAPNMFGDILGDLGTAIQGGLSFSCRGNINPESISMFEPIHGSAPKLKGQGIVNPIATIWAGALMLSNLGQQKSSDFILKSIESVLKEGKTRTQDIGGNNTTCEMGDSILDKLVEIHD